MSIQDHLYSQDDSLRELAAEFLSKTNSHLAAKQLVAELKNTDRYVAIRAAWGLSLMKPSLVVPHLVRALHGRDLDRLKQAAWALGRMESLKARRVLVSALKHRRRAVREHSAGALWQHALIGYKSKKVEGLLLGMLKGDRGHAALTLSRILKNHRRAGGERPDRRPGLSKASVFQRMGGAWIR